MNGPVLLFSNRGMRALFLHRNSRSRLAKTGSVDMGLNGNFTAYSPTNLGKFSHVFTHPGGDGHSAAEKFPPIWHCTSTSGSPLFGTLIKKFKAQVKSNILM